MSEPIKIKIPDNYHQLAEEQQNRFLESLNWSINENRRKKYFDTITRKSL